ncbi:cysteine--tRNA ligase [Candidatus Bathyarchaeota archaeon]|nr:MAG: cysteine--tRNA ligase [Candidatus Bathyarchaeota archaeon]
MTRTTESSLRVYNTLTRSLDQFLPIHPGRVNMFVCGPTVYDSSHIGLANTYVDYDIIARYIRRIGYSVFFVLNITDIDDRIISRARETGEDPLRLSSRYAQAFFKDMKDLRVESINLYAKASDYVPEIMDQVQGLIDKGIGYQIAGGVYYDTSKFPEYGKLSRQNLEQLTVHRIDPDPDKRNPSDFVIWKSQKPGEISWDSPWGKGRPGWHIEDTAITLTHFGPTYDLHGGGTDLIFPHHEAEIAQAEGLTGKKPLAKYWLHTGLLSISGRDMHKSLGNFIPIQEAIQRFGVSALRVLYASTHYRSPLEFTEEALTQAGSLARRFRRAYDQLERVGTDSHKSKARDPEAIKTTEGIEREFFAAMDDDFNTPGALAAYTKLVGMAEEHLRSPNPQSAKVLLETMKDLGSILGILEAESVPRANFSQLVELLVSLRADLRAKRDYGLSDRIREQMTRLGVTVEDEK